MDLSFYNGYILSGSLDKTIKSILFIFLYPKIKFFLVWTIGTKHCISTGYHRSSVNSVSIGPSRCVSGDTSGIIKIWEYPVLNLMHVFMSIYSGAHNIVTLLSLKL